MLFEFQIAGESRDADVCILGTLLQNGNRSSITHQGWKNWEFGLVPLSFCSSFPTFFNELGNYARWLPVYIEDQAPKSVWWVCYRKLLYKPHCPTFISSRHRYGSWAIYQRRFKVKGGHSRDIPKSSCHREVVPYCSRTCICHNSPQRDVCHCPQKTSFSPTREILGKSNAKNKVLDRVWSISVLTRIIQSTNSNSQHFVVCTVADADASQPTNPKEAREEGSKPTDDFEKIWKLQGWIVCFKRWEGF